VLVLVVLALPVRKAKENDNGKRSDFPDRARGRRRPRVLPVKKAKEHDDENDNRKSGRASESRMF
jgi:hypothetical protein